MTKPRRKSVQLKPVRLKIVGLILSESYQKCRLFAERLHKHHKKKFHQPSITGLLDMDWTEYKHKLQRQIGGKTWALKQPVAVFLDDSFIGGEKELFDYFRNYYYRNPSSEKIKEHAQREYLSCLNRGNLLYAYMELSQGGNYMGTLLFQLRHDIVPKSCMWFTEFCTHEVFSYEGTSINRVCKRGWFQTGKIPHQGILSLQPLDDENYAYKHDRRGILSFANDGKHTNRYQFFVTFEPAEWMDGKYVAFGRVVEGADLLRRIEHTPCTYEAPDKEILITGCGLAKVGLGRAVDPSNRLKGITVGTPHLHLDFFINLLFEKFDQILFDRLDEEVKRQIEEGGWIAEMIWSEFMDHLATTRSPFEDVLDPAEKTSRDYFLERYIAGLYSMPDIPDHFIRAMLLEAIHKAVDTCGARMIAKSVVDFLVNLAFDKAAMTQQIAEGIVQSLIKDVLRMIFGPEVEVPSTSTSVTFKGVKNALSEGCSLKSSLSDLKKRAGVVDGPTSKDHISTKESVAAYVCAKLLEQVANKI